MLMKQKTYFCLVAAVFSVIALLHLLRLIYGWEANIGGFVVPLCASWLALLISGFIALFGWKLSRCREPHE